MNVFAFLGVACLTFIGVTCYRVWRILKNLTGVLGVKLAEVERQRDSYADALASVLDQAGRRDLDGVVAHARQALETGDYHGRLRAAQDALEAATAAEQVGLPDLAGRRPR